MARRSARSSYRKWRQTFASAVTPKTGSSSARAPRSMRWMSARAASNCRNGATNSELPTPSGTAATLLCGRRRNQHEPAGLVVVDCVRGIHGCEHVGRLHPDRRVFVTRDVEDEKPVGL